MNHRLVTDSPDAFVIDKPSRHYAPDMRIYPVDGKLRLSFNFELGTLNGEVSWRLCEVAQVPTTLVFDAVDLEILSVSDEADVPLEYTYDGRQLEIIIDGTLSFHNKSIVFRWSIARPRAGLYFVRERAVEERGDAFDGFFTDHETERARYWLPCMDQPSIRTSLDVRLESDRVLRHLGPGVRMDSPQNLPTKSSHWLLSEPCPSYLICLAMGDLEECRLESCDGVSLDVYGFKPIGADQLRNAFGETSSMMNWMKARLERKFPYPKYWQFVAPGIGGAMENISLTSWDQRFFGDRPSLDEFGSVIDLVNLHEMAHSYFGDLVVIRDYAHAWLKEGWATYMESVWLEETKGAIEAQCLLEEDRLAYLEEVETRYVRPVVTREFNHSWHMYDRHLYQGSAWRLHMLRQRVGEESFWSATRTYLDEFGGGTAETGDFRRCLETASGLHLSRYFDDWFYRAACPVLTLSKEVVKDSDGFNVSVSLVMERPQDDGEFFEMELDVAVWDQLGQKHLSKMVFRNGRSVCNFCLVRPLAGIVVDPDAKCLFRLKGEAGAALYLSMLEQSPNPVALFQAFSALSSHSGDGVGLALAKAYKAELNGSVRRVLVKLLSRSEQRWKIGLLLDLLEWEQDPCVRFVIANGLRNGPLFESEIERLRDVVVSARGQFIRSSLLETLGSQRKEKDLSLLASTLLDPKESEVVRLGAMKGLGALGSESAYHVLRDHYHDFGNRVYLERGRHLAVANCAIRLGTCYVEEVLDWFSREARRVFGAEAVELSQACLILKDPRSLALIRTISSAVDHQVSSSIDRIAIKASSLSQGDRGAEKIEALERRLRKLEVSREQ